MSEYVGRTGSMRVYSYPERRASGDASPSFARNFASGPKNATPIPTDPGVQIEWNSLDAGITPSVDVPITPAVTGIVLISGVVNTQNPSGAPVDVILNVQLNDVSMSIPSSRVTIPAGGFMSIPFLTETIPSETPVGVTTNVQVLVTAPDTGDVVLLTGSGSAISIQEVSVASG